LFGWEGIGFEVVFEGVVIVEAVLVCVGLGTKGRL
jgi:hypothetical protein